MPVVKFRSFDDARRALWLPSDDPRILIRMRRLAQMARSRRTIRRGVTRLRSIEEAKRDKGAAGRYGRISEACDGPVGTGATQMLPTAEAAKLELGML